MDRASKRKGDGNDTMPNKKPKMSFAERMMAKMGYVEGSGLGKEGEGITSAIQVQVRPAGVGVGAVREKTAQQKAQEKRLAASRGEEYHDSSEEEREAAKRRRKVNRDVSAVSSGASTPGGGRPKTKYTIAQMESEGLHVPPSMLSIYDATTNETRLLTATSGPFVSAGSTDESAEARLAKRARRDLEAFASSFHNLSESKDAIEIEIEDLQRELDRLVERDLDHLRQLEASLSALATADTWPELLSTLKTAKRYCDPAKLEKIAIAAIHPLFSKETLDWAPLENPTFLSKEMADLCSLLPSQAKASDGFDRPKRQKTTHFESLMLKLWMPSVRASIANTDSETLRTKSDVVLLLEAWKDILPSFLLRSIQNQLFTKVSAELHDYNARNEVRRAIKRKTNALPTWIFQYLQYLRKEQIELLLADVNRKLRVILEVWPLEHEQILDLNPFRALLGSQLDDTLVKYLVPRLASHLRTEFVINPADQDLQPLLNVLKWQSVFKNLSIFSEIIISGFFPQFLDVLHTWLTSPAPNYDEIGEWLKWFKSVFPAEINELGKIDQQWNQAFQLTLHALDLGDEVASLPQPSAAPVQPAAETPAKTTVKDTPSKRTEVKETTFKEVVEMWCEEQGLFMVPLRKAEQNTGLPLFRITASAAQTGGIMVYFKGDVLWGQLKKDKNFEPMGLTDELVARAEGK